MGQGIISRILFGNQDPEKVARYNARIEGENSREYHDLKRQAQADKYANKVLKLVLEIKENNNNKMICSKLGNKLEKIYEKRGSGGGEATDIKKGGCDEENVQGFKEGEKGRQIGTFSYGLIDSILKKDELYHGLMKSRIKADFEMNGQDWKSGYEPLKFKKNQNKEKSRVEREKENDFDYMKFLKEQIYIPVLIEKQIEYGVYNGIPKEVCHPEMNKQNNDIDKQLELLKHQQAILDKQIELEKLKERNNDRR